MLHAFLILWGLLIVSATYFQFDAVKTAYRTFVRSRGRFYVYEKYDNVYLYFKKPTCMATLTNPDLTLCFSGSLKFSDRTYLHKSYILSYGPIIPGLLYLLLLVIVRDCQKIDKYQIKESYVNELPIQHPDPSSRS
jgi:hypothetical protein